MDWTKVVLLVLSFCLALVAIQGQQNWKGRQVRRTLDIRSRAKHYANASFLHQ